MTLLECNLPGIPKLRSGKVREVFDLGDSLLIVATDRISAFDCILPTGIPRKGEVLTQMTAFWYGVLDFVPNHFLTARFEAFPSVLHPFEAQLRNRSMIVRKANPLPVECVARGYIAGSGWKEYQTSGTVGGHEVPAGLVAVGRPLTELQGRAELMAVLAAGAERVAAGRDAQQTVEVHHSEQDLLYIQCVTSRVHDYRGQPAGTLTLLKDVTADYKSDQLKNQYLSIVAHELRTPLTGIKTFSTMMAKGSLGPLTEKQARVVDSIREQSLRLEHQIDKLINLGHLESDEYGQDREEFTLAEFASGLLAP